MWKFCRFPASERGGQLIRGSKLQVVNFQTVTYVVHNLAVYLQVAIWQCEVFSHFFRRFCMSRKGGTGEVGVFTLRMKTAWPLFMLGSAVERPWLALGGPLPFRAFILAVKFFFQPAREGIAWGLWLLKARGCGQSQISMALVCIAGSFKPWEYICQKQKSPSINWWK